MRDLFSRSLESLLMWDPIYLALHDFGVPNLKRIPIMFVQFCNKGAETMTVCQPKVKDPVSRLLFKVIHLLQDGRQQVGHVLGY